MRPSPSLLLRHAGVPALLITDVINIRYLTGIPLSTGILLVTKKAYLLFVDARYMEMAQKTAKAPVLIHDRAGLAASLSKMRTCGLEAEHVTISVLTSWKTKFKSTKFIHTEGIVEHFRRQKGSTEIRSMKKAIAITRQVMNQVPSFLVPGVKEKDVAWALESRARSLGAEKFSFEPIVAFGPHTSRPHHRAGERKLKKGDLVQIDIGVFYKGYSSDMSRVFATGPLTPQQKKAIEAVEKTKDVVMKAIKPGMTGKEVDTLAREVLKQYGWDKHMTHALGHGVGLDVHEGIVLAQRDDRPLLKGEAVAVEPGVYFPGKFGVRVEDIVFVN